MIKTIKTIMHDEEASLFVHKKDIIVIRVERIDVNRVRVIYLSEERENLMLIEINRLRLIVQQQQKTITKYRAGIKALLNENGKQAE